MANNYQIGFYASISNLKTIESQVTQIQKKINSVSGINNQTKSAKESSKVFNEMFKTQDLQISKNYQKYYNDLAGGINNQTKSAKESSKVFNEMFKAQDLQISQISKNYQKYYNDLAGGINNQTKSARASANVFKELFATTKDGAKGFSDLQKKVVNLSGGLENGKKASMTFGSRIKEAMKSSVEWAVAMGVLYGAIRKVRETIQTVIALDNQMTNIRMVTGASIEQAEKYLKVYQDIADQTSSTTLEVAKASETWLRQGRSIEDTNSLIKTSSVFSRVAFLESAEAATLLTSAINGYGLSAKDAMSVVDKLSAVDVNAATGADDLARALRQTASSAKIAGVGMDDLLGYIAVVKDVTQKSADSINKICGVATIINKVA